VHVKPIYTLMTTLQCAFLYAGIKHVPSLSSLPYPERLALLDLEPLELRRLGFDLIYFLKCSTISPLLTQVTRFLSILQFHHRVPIRLTCNAPLKHQINSYIRYFIDKLRPGIHSLLHSNLPHHFLVLSAD
jgi:hypothetical protein